MKLLNRKQIISLIKAVGHLRTVVIQGENGVGKTSIFHELCRDPMFANHIKTNPVDCMQLSDGSVWMPDVDREQGVSRELPNERFGVSKNNQKGVNGSRPVLVFLDEILKTRQYIKDMIAPMIYDRRNGSYHFVEGSVICCATNLAMEGLGDIIQPHLKSRLITVTMAKPTCDEWVQHATDFGMAAEVIACADEHPMWFDSFLDYMPNGKHHGKVMSKDNAVPFNPNEAQDGYVSPRTLHIASDIVHNKDLVDTDTMQAALEGTIGATAAEALAAYIRFGQDNPSFDEVRANPAHARVASSPVAQIVMAFKLVTNTQDRDDAEAATEYVARLKGEMQNLFVNRVANTTSRLSHFLTVAPFQKMLAANKIYFSNK
jgi:hypothetical protein